MGQFSYQLGVKVKTVIKHRKKVLDNDDELLKLRQIQTNLISKCYVKRRFFTSVIEPTAIFSQTSSTHIIKQKNRIKIFPLKTNKLN